MTPNQFVRLVKSFQHRKNLSLSLEDLESKIISFLTANHYQNRTLIIAGWKILFNGKSLSVTEAPYKSDKQLKFEWEGGDPGVSQGKVQVRASCYDQGSK